MFGQQDPIPWGGALGIAAGVGLVLVVSGAAMISLARRTADGRIGPNGWTGVRTSATRSSDEAWHAAHRVAEVPTVRAGWSLVATGILGFVLAALVGWGDGERAMLTWGITVGVGTTLLTGLVLKGAWDGHQAAKRVRDG